MAEEAPKQEDQASVGSATPSTQPAPVASNPTAGIAPNVAGALSYLVGFITGIFFFATSKDKFVRFHAMQSILLSVTVMVLSWVLSALVFSSWLTFGFLYSIYQLLVFVLWLYMMWTAYQNKKVVLPVIGNIAEGQANK